MTTRRSFLAALLAAPAAAAAVVATPARAPIGYICGLPVYENPAFKPLLIRANVFAVGPPLTEEYLRRDAL